MHLQRAEYGLMQMSLKISILCFQVGVEREGILYYSILFVLHSFSFQTSDT